MATYVTSDAHGHLRALDRALELAGVGERDALYVMGDMIDRGPDPLGVVRLVRSLPQARVLMGNHERLMLDALASDDPGVRGGWQLNGGWTTSEQLDALPSAEFVDLVDWAASLRLWDVVEVEDRVRASRYPLGAEPRRAYLLAHAGIDARSARFHLSLVPGGPSRASVPELRSMMAAQRAEDLLWIREGFWSAPTGLVDERGLGPIAVAGHTPSVLARRFCDLPASPILDAGGRARVVEVGACSATGGVPDRIDIDAAAAGGAPNGQVAVVRLEDMAVWYAPVEEGE